MQLKFIRKNPLFFALLLITFFLALFFRLYNYPFRIAVVSDHARDVQVAHFAFDHGKIPQIGQFSSAGPFFYGPWWYWFLELFTFFPLGSLTHWYLMTILSLAFIALMYYLGNYVGGKWTGLLSAFLASISPAQITNSFAVWNPAIIPLLSLIILILLVKCYQNNIWHNFFLLGFTLGLALTIHFQSILLIPTLLLGGLCAKKSFKNYLFLFAGFSLPFMPLIYFDARFHWSNFRNIWQYLTVGQYNIYVPNRWLTYIGNYWPDTWSNIAGGNYWISWVIIFFLAIFTLIGLVRFSLHKKIYLVIAAFLLEIVLFRYYRGERFFYYSFFAHPYVILLTGWTIWQLLKRNKIIALFLFLLISIFTIKKALETLVISDINFIKILATKQEIYAKYHNETFDIYGCNFTEGNLVSYPLAYFMYLDGRNEPGGRKIGLCFTGGQPIGWKELSQKELEKAKPTWFNRTTEQVFKETAEWWKENPPSTPQ